jgi:hypothetical protein
MDEKERAEITRKLAEPVPDRLIQEKNGKTYVEAEYVRERLIQATGNNFDWVVDQKQEYRDDGAISQEKATAANVVTGEKMPILTAICWGKLTIPGLGTRSGVGVQEMQHKSGADAAYKGAESDAFKRAAMAFGVGLQQLYIDTNKHEQQRARQTASPSLAKLVMPTEQQLEDLRNLTGALGIKDAEKRLLIGPVRDFTQEKATRLIEKLQRDLEQRGGVVLADQTAPGPPMASDGQIDSIRHLMGQLKLPPDQFLTMLTADEAVERIKQYTADLSAMAEDEEIEAALEAR